MRVIGKPGLVVRRTPRLEVVEEEEGIEMVESTGSQAPPEMHPGAFDHGLRRHDLRDAARGLTHGWDLLVDVTLPSGGSYHPRPLAPEAGLGRGAVPALQQRAGTGHRDAPVAHRSLLLRGELGEGGVERRIVEDGIITEPARAHSLVEQDAVDLAFHRGLAAGGRGLAAGGCGLAAGGCGLAAGGLDD